MMDNVVLCFRIGGDFYDMLAASFRDVPKPSNAKCGGTMSPDVTRCHYLRSIVTIVSFRGLKLGSHGLRGAVRARVFFRCRMRGAFPPATLVAGQRVTQVRRGAQTTFRGAHSGSWATVATVALASTFAGEVIAMSEPGR